MADEQFPSEVLSLFGAQRDAAESEPDDDDVLESGADDSGDDYSDPDPQPRKDSGRDDVDKIARQRDAVIREKGQLARERRETQERIRRLEQTLAEANKEKEKKPEVQVPDPKKDPIGYLEHRRKLEVESLSNNISELKTKLVQMENQSRASELVTYVKNDEQSFRAEKPDYDEAMNFLDNAVYNYFVQNGLDEVAAAEGLDMWRAELFENVLRMRLPIAKTFYEHAVHAGHKANGKRAKSTAIDSVKRGMEAGSLGSIGRASTGNDNQRISIEQYRQLHQFDPIKLMIANDTNLFRQLAETGHCDLPTQ